MERNAKHEDDRTEKKREGNNSLRDVTTNGGTSDWLNEKFFETILRRDMDNTTLHVVKIDVRGAVPAGDNYMSVMKQVSVEYRLSEEKETIEKCSLIVKTLPEGEYIQSVIADMEAFRKESHMYRVTLPAMYQLAMERMRGDQERLTARSYHCSRPDTIVLQDLKPLDYKMADRRQHLDLHHSAMALRTLAKLHALSVALHAKHPRTMDAYAESIYTEKNRKNHHEFLGKNFSALATVVSTWQGFEQYEDKLQRLSQVVVDRTMEVVKNCPGKMRVLNHGDLWTNNVMYRYHSDDTISDVMLLDFQMMRFASPALDIVYFMFTSPTQQVFENNWDEMLEQYHDALCDTMRRMGCDQDLFISLEQLHQEMEDKAFYAVMVTILFAIMGADPENAVDMSQLTEEDLESGNVNMLGKVFANNHFRKVMQIRLPMFESQGLI